MISRWHHRQGRTVPAQGLQPAQDWHTALLLCGRQLPGMYRACLDDPRCQLQDQLQQTKKWPSWTWKSRVLSLKWEQQGNHL